MKRSHLYEQIKAPTSFFTHLTLKLLLKNYEHYAKKTYTIVFLLLYPNEILCQTHIMEFVKDRRL